MGDSVVAEEGRAAAASCKPARQQAVLGIVGWSGSGKTTLIERLLPALCLSGMRVSTIKHSHHDIVLDAEGKDSARHRLAGAAEVMVVSPHRWGLFVETAQSPDLTAQLARMAPVDLVLIEGQKHLQIPKIEVWRPALGRTPRYGEDPCVIAVATDAMEDLAGACSLPVLNLDAVESVADFVLAQWRQGCLYPLLSSSQSSSQR